MSDHTPLKRAFSLPLLTLYGLGTILGAGIYVLLGEVAGRAGVHAPLAFFLAAVHPLTRTPLRSTVLVSGVILVLALWLPLLTLAELTSLITLTVFSLINLALWRIKRRDPRPVGLVVYPQWLPMCGFILSLTFLLWQLWQRVMS